MLLRGDAELVVEGVVPDLLHVAPVGDETTFNCVSRHRQNATLGNGLIADVCFLLVHAYHYPRMLGAAYNGREHGSRCIVAGEASLAHAGAAVDDDSERVVILGLALDYRGHLLQDTVSL